jgi:N-acetyl-anhydromuramyl-L-alanine amidase AmpD
MSSNSPSNATDNAGWCPFAIQRPITANNYDVGRSGHSITAVVLHIAAGPLTAVFPTFNNPGGLASAHFCVGKDGKVEQYVSINDTAYAVGMRYVNGVWHNPRGIACAPSWSGLIPPYNPNLYTLSIEHEGQPEDHWTPQMYDANNKLLQWIAEQLGQRQGRPFRYIVHQTLIGHYEIDPVDRPNCPGPNVEWDRIAADANRVQPAPDLAAAVQAAAQKLTWLPINTGSALYKFAQAQNLGCPQTDEFSFTAADAPYIGQVYNLGIAYVKQGDWSNVQWVQKPDGAAPTSDPVALAAITAAQQEAWLPINTGSALYKFAQAQNLGCPQTDEFEVNVGDDYVCQVYNLGIEYAKKSDLSQINWVAKPQVQAG